MESNNNRIAKNTLLLSVRLILLILIQLYTVPLVLKALGVSDYGLYNVVGGVVTMFSFIGGSLASGSQRSIAYALGLKDEDLLKSTFNSIISIYGVFAIIVIILLETWGLWFLNYRMNIPPDRLFDSNCVFQLSLLSFVIDLITIPFVATTIAHEKMSFYAYASVLECIIKLVVAIALQYILTERLIIYATLICLNSIIIKGGYWWYCRAHFIECKKNRLSWNHKTGKELLAYSGWNALGSVALISRQQGLNILLNLSFGMLVNAAYAIAHQVYGALMQFVNNVYTASRPQITKYYATADTGKMWQLVFRSGKMAYYILMLLAIPLVVEMETVLNLWIGNPPQYTLSMAILMIISLLIETQVYQLIAVFQAANKLRKIQIYSSLILLGNPVLSYFVLKWIGGTPLVPYIIFAVLSVLYNIVVLWQAKITISLNIKTYLQIIGRMILVSGMSLLAVGYIAKIMSPSFLRLCCTILYSVVVIPIIIWIIGLDVKERSFCANFIRKKIRSLKK